MPTHQTTNAGTPPIRRSSSSGRADKAKRPESREPVPAAEAAPDSETALYQAITRALLTGKLAPGTPLRERYLAEQFDMTRGAVRKVLTRLGTEGKLEIFPNRGAYVPQPSSQDMAAVYGARKAVEAGVVALLAGRITRPMLAKLRAHVKLEHSVALTGHRDESVRLAGDFHRVLAQMVGNPEIDAILQQLVARTQMFVALFESARHAGCAPDEHERVVAALEGDPAAAVQAMLDHLSQVEERVMAQVRESETRPVADILRASLGE